MSNLYAKPESSAANDDHFEAGLAKIAGSALPEVGLAHNALLERLGRDFADGIVDSLKHQLMIAVHAEYSNDEIMLTMGKALYRANLAFLANMKDHEIIKVLEEQAFLQNDFLKKRSKT